MTTAAPASDPIMMPAPRADARGAKRKAGGDAHGFAAALRSVREGKPESGKPESGKAEAGQTDERARAGVNIVIPPQLRFDAKLEIERSALPLTLDSADEAGDADDLPLIAAPETDETEDAPPAVNPLIVAFTAITASVVRVEQDGKEAGPASGTDTGLAALAANEAAATADKGAVDVKADIPSETDAPAKPLVDAQPAPHRAAAETAVRAAVAAPQPDAANVAPRVADTGAGPVASFNAALAAGSQARSGDQSDGRQDGQPGQRNRRDDGVSARVTVVAEQSIPAPASPASATSSALVAGLTGDSGWHSALRSVAAMQRVSGQMNGAPVHSMKLQLHPAELGMVTADLRFSGDQLAVELKVENAEAYHRLSSDSDSIVASLKALGYDIDQVTIAQSSVANSAGGRPDGGAGADRGSAGGNAFAASGGDGSDRNRAGGQAAARDQGRDGRQGYAGAQSAAEGNGRGLYI